MTMSGAYESMQSTRVRLADWRVLLKHRTDHVAALCRAYADPFEEEAELTVSATDEELAQERAEAPSAHSEGYIESVCLYRALCRLLPDRGGLLFHAAVIAHEGRGYGFSAPSGTGKSTHIRLWRQAFGDSVTVINGDKPILRRTPQGWYAYGTPWCGKEGWQTNSRVRLEGLCFLVRGSVNQLTSLTPTAGVDHAMRQILIPPDPKQAAATLALLHHLLAEVPLYLLRCTPEEEAARIAREGMTRATTESGPSCGSRHAAAGDAPQK